MDAYRIREHTRLGELAIAPHSPRRAPAYVAVVVPKLAIITGARLALVVLLTSAPLAARAQVVRDSASATSSARSVSASASVRTAVRAQSDFETFRFDNLPGPTPYGSCTEHPRDDCYWAHAATPRAPDEPAVIRDRREQLIRLLDSVAVSTPGDRWAVEQRVRYLEEAGRPDSALAAARACRVVRMGVRRTDWFRAARMGRYAAADSVYGHALAQMSAKDRCDWRNVDLLIEDDLHHQYAQVPCGDPRRERSKIAFGFSRARSTRSTATTHAPSTTREKRWT